MIKLNDCERRLIRRGCLLDPFGLLRALRCNDYKITKARWESLVRINYFIEDESTPEWLKERIKKAWDDFVEITHALDIKILENSDNLRIKMPQFSWQKEE